MPPPNPVDCFAYSSPYTEGHVALRSPSHQVYMYFFKRGGWEVQFLEADLRSPSPKAHFY